MILSIIVGAGAIAGLGISLSTMNKNVIALASGLSIGIAITLLLPEYRLIGEILYTVFLGLTFLHSLKISKLAAKAPLMAASGAMVYYWVWTILHLPGRLIIGPLIALGALCLSLLSKLNKTHLGLLIIIIADALALVTEWVIY